MAGWNRKKISFIEPLLRDWYGKEQGDAEILRYTPETRPISDPLDKVMQRLLPPREWKVSLIQEKWAEIAGPENARRCAPSFLDNGIFYIEVSHPAYRIALETPAIKSRILERIQTVVGSEVCRNIKFIAGGRTAPRKK